MSRFREGNMVELIQSNHQDLQIGDCGVVEQVLPDGYAVRFTGEFGFADSPHKRRTDDRTVFVPESAATVASAKVQNPALFAVLQLLQEKILADKAESNARSKQLPARN